MSGRMSGPAIGALAGLALGVSGVAVATSAATPGVITACVGANGAVRIPVETIPSRTPTAAPTEPQSINPLPSGTTSGPGCQPGERTVTWNETGRQGDPGPTGQAGPKGDPGPALGGPARLIYGFDRVELGWQDTKTVMKVRLPAGAYVVNASVKIWPGSGYNLKSRSYAGSCWIPSIPAAPRDFWVSNHTEAPNMQIDVHNVFNLQSEADVTVLCQGFAIDRSFDLYVEDGTMIVQRVSEATTERRLPTPTPSAP